MLSRDIHTEIFAEGGWDKRIQAEIAAALVHALEYKEYKVRSSVVRIFTGVIAQGALLGFHEIFIVTEIFPEGFRDKIFDTKIVAALVRALGNSHSDVSVFGGPELNPGSGALEFFTAAVAQGALLCCMGYYR